MFFVIDDIYTCCNRSNTQYYCDCSTAIAEYKLMCFVVDDIYILYYCDCNTYILYYCDCNIYGDLRLASQ